MHLLILLLAFLALTFDLILASPLPVSHADNLGVSPLNATAVSSVATESDAWYPSSVNTLVPRDVAANATTAIMLNVTDVDASSDYRFLPWDPNHGPLFDAPWCNNNPSYGYADHGSAWNDYYSFLNYIESNTNAVVQVGAGHGTCVTISVPDENASFEVCNDNTFGVLIDGNQIRRGIQNILNGCGSWPAGPYKRQVTEGQIFDDYYHFNIIVHGWFFT